MRDPKITLLCFLLAILSAFARAQSASTAMLDPTRSISPSSPAAHTLLPEQYIWTAGDVTARLPDHNKYPWNRSDLRIAPHFFRARFHIQALPRTATLYIAGPREAHVYLNGTILSDFYSNVDAPIGFHVFHADAAKLLRPGDNVLAIETVRGRGIVTGDASAATQQLTYGEILVATIVPAPFGVDVPALVITNSDWKSTATAAERWSEPGFDDSAWPAVETLGPVESNVDFFQWSADAGMYGWPGYMGMSPALRTYSLRATAVTHVFAGRARFDHLDALSAKEGNASFTVTNPNANRDETDADAPSLLLDFGREVAGRLLVESASPADSLLSIAYGESEIEAMSTGLTPVQQGGNYLVPICSKSKRMAWPADRSPASAMSGSAFCAEPRPWLSNPSALKASTIRSSTKPPSSLPIPF
jgi:alpha-L-rhamnosidase